MFFSVYAGSYVALVVESEPLPWTIRKRLNNPNVCMSMFVHGSVCFLILSDEYSVYINNLQLFIILALILCVCMYFMGMLDVCMCRRPMGFTWGKWRRLWSCHSSATVVRSRIASRRTRTDICHCCTCIHTLILSLSITILYVCIFYVLEQMYAWIYDRSYDLSMYVCMYVNPIVYSGCIGSGRSRSTSSSSLSPVTSLSRSRTLTSFSRSSSQTLSGPEPIIGDKNMQHIYIHTYIPTYKKTKKI